MAVVESRGEVRVTDLAAELEVSVITARRDVEDLARAGRLRRGHGVARSLVPARRAPVPGERGTGVVALVVPERHVYLNEVVHGARAALEDAGARIVLHPAPQVAGAERPIVERALAEGDVRGLLIAPLAHRRGRGRRRGLAGGCRRARGPAGPPSPFFRLGHETLAAGRWLLA
ncbi:DeoR family transcriptional regulator [Amycolatopsis sp. NPDC051371]|uniref:DeoR family transcriptional regulator n=1 Tax=Amycolatopsis sp. NPDC051371 TaxID=3155800 RepID=UPI003437D3AA